MQGYFRDTNCDDLAMKEKLERLCKQCLLASTCFNTQITDLVVQSDLLQWCNEMMRPVGPFDRASNQDGRWDVKGRKIQMHNDISTPSNHTRGLFKTMLID